MSFNPEDEEDDFGLSAPVAPPMPAAPPPMDPTVRDNVMKKFNLGPYSPEARQKLVDQNQDYDTTGAIAGALASLGAGFQGKDSMAAVNQVQNQRTARRADDLSQFDKGRDAKIQEYKVGQEVTKDQRENAKSDPNSESSVSFRKMMEANFPKVAQAYGPDWANVTAADQENIFKPLQLKEQVEARKQAAALLAGQRKDAREEKLDALSTTQSKQLGLFNSGKAAENQYTTATGGENAFDPSSLAHPIDNSSWAPTFLKSDKAIASQNAQNAWIESFLRDASGAAIAHSERDAYKKDFFPQPGDPADVVANKAALRHQKMENALTGAGRLGKQALAEFRSEGAGGGKTIVKQYAGSDGSTKVVYSDGTEKIIPANVAGQ